MVSTIPVFRARAAGGQVLRMGGAPALVAAVSIRSSSTAQTSAGSAASPAVPTGAAIGDVMIALVNVDTTATAATTVAAPAGWTRLDTQLQPTPDGMLAEVYWKRLSAADTGTYNFTYGGPSADMSVSVACLMGAHASNPPVLSTAATQATAVSSPMSITANGVTAIAKDALLYLVSFDCVTIYNPAWTAPTGYSDVVIAPGTGFVPSYIGGKTNASAGATGTVTGTATFAGKTAGWVTWLIRVPSA